MGGIEFYPQKEFDEDMEDKSDNDKIRVSASVLSFTHILSNESFPPSLTHSLSLSHTLTHCFLQTECQGTGACCVFVSSHKSCAALFATLNRVEMSLSIGGDALCCGGQRQRISSEWQTSSGEEDSVGDCRRWVIWPVFSVIYSHNIEMILMVSGKGQDVTLDSVQFFCCS